MDGRPGEASPGIKSDADVEKRGGNSAAVGAAASSETRNSGTTQRAAAPRKRIRNFTADDRAAHRVFEKSRREAFKGRLTELASLIPALLHTESRRLSKHVVVDESIARHRLQQSRCESAAHGIRALLKERDALLEEVNQYRAEARGARGAVVLPMVYAEAFADLFAAEQEVFKARSTSHRATPSAVANGAGAPDDGDSPASRDSPRGNSEDIVGVMASQAPPMDTLDPGLQAMGTDPRSAAARAASGSGVVSYSSRPSIDATAALDKDAAAALTARGQHHPDYHHHNHTHNHNQHNQHHHHMQQHAAGIYGEYGLAGVAVPSQYQRPSAAHHHPQQHAHSQQKQHHHPTIPASYIPHAHQPGQALRAVDMRHDRGPSPVQQQPLAPSGMVYDAASAAGAAAAAAQNSHGNVPIPQHGHGSGGHGGGGQAPGQHSGTNGTHGLSLPPTTTQGPPYMGDMGTMPYMGNMGWQ